MFAPDDVPIYVLEANTHKPGIYCLIDDLELNEELIEQSEHDPDDIVEPVFEPKRLNELHKPLHCDVYRMGEEKLKVQADMVIVIKRKLAVQALAMDQKFKLVHPDGVVQDKRLETLVQKRNPRPKFHKETFWKLGSDDYGPNAVRKRKHLCDLCPRELEAII